MANGLRRRVRQLRQLALFAVIPLIGILAPLAIVPMVSARYGADGWASVAVALGIGNAGLLIAEVGWGVVGPQRVARPDADRAAVWSQAHASRIVSTAVVAPLVAVVAAVAVPDHRGAAALLAGALVLGAMSPSWFFIGVGKPLLVLACDTAPRVALVLASAVAIALGGPIWLYGAGVLLGAVTMLALSRVLGRLRMVPPPSAFLGLRGIVREQLALSAGRAVSTLYSSLPATFLGFVSPGAIAVFAASDRPMRMGFNVLGAVQARLQSWIGSADTISRATRCRRAVLMQGVMGAVAAIVFVIAMPVVAPVLFAGALEVPIALAAVSGATVFVMCVSSGLGLCLVAYDRSTDIPKSIVVAAIVGVPAVLVLGASFGAMGAACGVLAAELAGALAQGAFLVRRPRLLHPAPVIAS